MKTKFKSFSYITESKKNGYLINFSDESKELEIEFGNKMAKVLRENLIGRIINFYTKNFFDKNFNLKTSTSHNAIMKVEDVIYRYESKGMYTSPFLIKSNDRKNYVYFDIIPKEKFFYIDSFLDDFNKNYIEKEISFFTKKPHSESHLVKKIIGVPTKIYIVLDGLWQTDVLKVDLENGKSYFIDYKKNITNLENMKKFDPYGEENW